MILLIMNFINAENYCPFFKERMNNKFFRIRNINFKLRNCTTIIDINDIEHTLLFFGLKGKRRHELLDLKVTNFNPYRSTFSGKVFRSYGLGFSTGDLVNVKIKNTRTDTDSDLS